MKSYANLRTNTFNTASSSISVSLPRSKSIVILCLIVNYIRNGTLLPINENDPKDIKIVYNALKAI
jgi:hypothetical protein